MFCFLRAGRTSLNRAISLTRVALLKLGWICERMMVMMKMVLAWKILKLGWICENVKVGNVFRK